MQYPPSESVGPSGGFRMGVSDGEGLWLGFDGRVTDRCYEMSPFIANAVVEYANKYNIGQDAPNE